MGTQENNSNENTINDIENSYGKASDTSKKAINSGRNIGTKINNHKNHKGKDRSDSRKSDTRKSENDKSSDKSKNGVGKNQNSSSLPVNRKGLLSGNGTENTKINGEAGNNTKGSRSNFGPKAATKAAKHKASNGIKKAGKALLLNPITWIVSALAVFGVVLMVIVVIIVSMMGSSKRHVDISMEGLPPFITEEMVVALVEMREEYGDPPSVGLAQIIKESGFGTYGPHGDTGQGLSGLAYDDKNLFGMKTGGKCSHRSGAVTYKTGEQTKDGSTYTICGTFSKYPSYEDCIRCRSECFIPNGYYPKCVAARDTSTSWTKEKADAYVDGLYSWATDISYLESLKNLMEQYDLYRFDNMGEDDVSAEMGSGKRDGTFGSPIGGVSVKSLYYTAHTFQWRSTRYHQGCDLGYPGGTPVVASDGGTVTQRGYNSVRGNYVVVYHGDGWMTVYQHLSIISVKTGQKVSKGQTLGGVGTTGSSTGNHLHFEIHEGVSESTAKTTIPYDAMNHKGAYSSSARYCEDYLKD